MKKSTSLFFAAALCLASTQAAVAAEKETITNQQFLEAHKNLGAGLKKFVDAFAQWSAEDQHNYQIGPHGQFIPGELAKRKGEGLGGHVGVHVDRYIALDGYDQITHLVFAIDYLKEIKQEQNPTEEEATE